MRWVGGGETPWTGDPSIKELTQIGRQTHLVPVGNLEPVIQLTCMCLGFETASTWRGAVTYKHRFSQTQEGFLQQSDNTNH